MLILGINTVADACEELCQAAKYVTQLHGGKGAVHVVGNRQGLDQE